MTASAEQVADGQASELPAKRAEDAAWTPIVLTPAERLCDWLQRRLGVETANEPIAMLNEVMADAYEFGRRAATNQPEPLHEVACPECGTTIRARMADQPGQDLRELLVRKLRTVHANIEPRHPDNWCGDASSACSACTDGFLDFGELAGHLTAAVQAYVDSQVAAARADERAKVLAIHRKFTNRDVLYCLSCMDGDGYPIEWPCATARALGVEGDRG